METKNPIVKCDCMYDGKDTNLLKDMKYIGQTDRQIHFSDLEGKNTGVRSELLYQCPNCKLIAII